MRAADGGHQPEQDGVRDVFGEDGKDVDQGPVHCGHQGERGGSGGQDADSQRTGPVAAGGTARWMAPARPRTTAVQKTGPSVSRMLENQSTAASARSPRR